MLPEIGKAAKTLAKWIRRCVALLIWVLAVHFLTGWPELPPLPGMNSGQILVWDLRFVLASVGALLVILVLLGPVTILKFAGYTISLPIWGPFVALGLLWNIFSLPLGLGRWLLRPFKRRIPSKLLIVLPLIAIPYCGVLVSIVETRSVVVVALLVLLVATVATVVLAFSWVLAPVSICFRLGDRLFRWGVRFSKSMAFGTLQTKRPVDDAVTLQKVQESIVTVGNTKATLLRSISSVLSPRPAL